MQVRMDVSRAPRFSFADTVQKLYFTVVLSSTEQEYLKKAQQTPFVFTFISNV